MWYVEVLGRNYAPKEMHLGCNEGDRTFYDAIKQGIIEEPRIKEKRVG